MVLLLFCFIIFLGTGFDWSRFVLGFGLVWLGLGSDFENPKLLFKPVHAMPRTFYLAKKEEGRKEKE